ncbi:MAG: hypothetical protein Q8M18_21420 [Bradyrhizobium sp.]|nr:hypothetical protein [Bradyrhizobium sp.]
MAYIGYDADADAIYITVDDKGSFARRLEKSRLADRCLRIEREHGFGGSFATHPEDEIINDWIEAVADWDSWN